jgi:hypothetical protein
VRQHGVKAQHRSRPGDTHDHLSFAIAARGEFEMAAADEVEASRVVSLMKERSLRGQSDGTGGEFKIGKDRTPQRTEPPRASIRASCASGRDLAG